MFKSRGIIRYGPGIRVAVWLSDDNQIASFYRKLLPKAWYVQPQKYRPHITVVRSGKESPDLSKWDLSKYRHDGEIVEFYYDNDIKHDNLYYYLNVSSDRIGYLRLEMGLSRFRFSDNPYYHMTIGNVK